MTPGTFSVDNCDELIPDERRRAIAEKARADAAAGVYDPPQTPGDTYWGVVLFEHERIYYIHTHAQRTARLRRTKEPV